MSEASQTCPREPLRHQRRTRSLLGAGLATALAASAGVGVTPVTATAASARTKGPSCDQIAGYTRARSDRWRLLVLQRGSVGAHTPLVACRRDQPGPARIRQLGKGAPFAEFDTVTNGVVQLVGDRVLLVSASGSSGGSRAAYTLIDLSAGRSRVLGVTNSSSNGGTLVALRPVLTPTGALATLSGQSEGPPPILRLQLWDAAGQGPLGAEAKSIAPSLGTGPADSGIYVSDSTGVLSRQIVAGPFPPQLLTPRTSLRVRAPHLIAKPAPKTEQRTELRTFEEPGDGGIELITRKRRGARPSSAAIRLSTPPDGRRSKVTAYPLAAGSASEVKVLGVNTYSVLVAARFADDPGRRRIRLLSLAGYTTVPVDIDATPVAERPGQATLSASSTVAIADGATIRLWRPRIGPPEITSTPAVGAHDLIDAYSAIWFTDTAGAPQQLPLTDD